MTFTLVEILLAFSAGILSAAVVMNIQNRKLMQDTQKILDDFTKILSNYAAAYDEHVQWLTGIANILMGVAPPQQDGTVEVPIKNPFKPQGPN